MSGWVMSEPIRGKYRWRTWMRVHLPYRLIWIAPKGRDCGDHQWYKSDERTDHCYFCKQQKTRKA